MGRGKRFVEIKMAHISAHFARANDSKHPVIVRHIAYAQTADLVNFINKLE